MAFQFKYVPVFRSRQQELLVLKNFDFKDKMYPLVEIIKEKDRSNNARPVQDIWLEYIIALKSEKVFIDLPTYIRDNPSMQDEVLTFNRTTLSNLQRRISFFNQFISQSAKVIPVVSTLYFKTREENSLTNQVKELRKNFPVIAIRTFTNSLEKDLPEIKNLLTTEDILIYDMDTVQPLNPFVKKQMSEIASLKGIYKVAIRSAINIEIQNIKLDHEEVVAEADNSLLDIFQSILKVDAFGDYAGVKKDELTSGGTISPGFLLFDPIENLFYGYKGEIKNLSEFADTIVPSVLQSAVIKRMKDEAPEYLTADNWGYNTLLAIDSGQDSGKSQAKFKRISIEHYLFCLREMISNGKIV